ncbi:hypothetical protein [Solidesulfovibrio sp.]|uniref:hypothetical protein n=1 Tax=Solidesulfovibrio sp. TaxID=2910990 RepID=UPI002B21FFE6|nr:hypothetical protein [Solidesulfovibrio sp.]MEA4856052.1 hypothetical protein [Solidesulfovibrio sp.]
MNIMQSVPEGVIGIVGLEMIRAAKSKYASEIVQIQHDFSLGLGHLNNELDVLHAQGLMTDEGVCTVRLRALNVDRAIVEYLTDQLAAEEIKLSL